MKKMCNETSKISSIFISHYSNNILRMLYYHLPHVKLSRCIIIEVIKIMYYLSLLSLSTAPSRTNWRAWKYSQHESKKEQISVQCPRMAAVMNCVFIMAAKQIVSARMDISMVMITRHVANTKTNCLSRGESQ